MSVISFEDMPELINKAKNILIVTGGKSTDYMIDSVIKLSDAKNAHVAATGNTIANFRDRTFTRCSKEWIAEVVNNMTLPDWKGYDGKGKPDLLIFIGYLGSLLNRFLAGLKTFTDCKTLTLDNRYLSNANYSLASSSKKEWEMGLKRIIENL